VLGVYRVSDLEVNTLDHDLPHDDPLYDKVTTQFPYALHPIKV